MKQTSKVMLTSFFTNFFLSLLKMIIGWIGKSSALVADGIHSFSDLITDIVALFGNFLSRKPADKEHPYGHGKSEYVTNLVIGMIVFFLGVEIIISTFQKEVIIPSTIVIYVSLFTIVSKFLLSSFLIRKGKQFKNTILISSGKESSADVLSSFFVLVSSILMQYADKVSYLKYADGCATIIVGCFVLHTGYSILKENISIVLEEQDSDIERQEKIRTVIQKNEFIKSIDQFILTKYGPYSKLDLEISMDGGLTLFKAHEEAHKIERKIKRADNRIQYVKIHINVYEEGKE